MELNEPIGGDWTMVSSSHTWTKTEAWAARFTAPVAAGGETRVRYRVRIAWRTTTPHPVFVDGAASTSPVTNVVDQMR